MDPTAPDPLDVVTAATANLVGWHQCSVAALGFPGRCGEHWWTSPTPAPWIYFTAIELGRHHTASDVRAARAALGEHLHDPRGGFEAVCVSFDDLDLDLDADGLRRRSAGLWYARPPAPVDADDDRAEDLAITEVGSEDDLSDFERATCAAFDAPPPTAPFDVHAPPILADPRMHVLIGRRDGTVVSGAMAYIDEQVIGIYGVGTIPGHRGRGYASALTLAALRLAPGRVATLQPSAAAARLYRRLGFAEVGRFSHWG